MATPSLRIRRNRADDAPLGSWGFRHKGIERFFTTGIKSGIQAKHADRLRLILGRLNSSTIGGEMNFPDLGLHELRGSRKGAWAVTVSGNWRVTFTCAGKDVDRVDYEDRSEERRVGEEC